MPDKNILIIGGAGFIGVNSARYFYNQGWGVTIFDNCSRRGTELNLKLLQADCPGVAVRKGDVRDAGALAPLMEEAEAVLHLAAQVAVTASVASPREDFEVNALGTFNVLEAVRCSRRQPLVLFASTNKVYGGLEDRTVAEGETRYEFISDKAGVNEAVPLDFHSPYGCSKGAADQYVRDYARIYKLRTVVFRQSCVYGPHQFGVEDQGWVAWFIIAGLLGRPVTIYGNGKQVRDLLFVDDLVKVYDLAIQKIGQVSGRIYNIGGGPSNTLSLLEFIRLLKSDQGLELQPSFSDWRPGDQPIFVSDNRRVETELGWRQTTDVRAGIGRLIAWLKARQPELEVFYA